MKLESIRKISIAFIMTAVGGVSHAADKAEPQEMIATIINMNGLLCAKVVDIRPLKVKSGVYEVTCIEYRGGVGQKTYIMDAAKGTAWAP